jgi:hypothetical protein
MKYILFEKQLEGAAFLYLNHLFEDLEEIRQYESPNRKYWGIGDKTLIELHLTDTYTGSYYLIKGGDTFVDRSVWEDMVRMFDILDKDDFKILIRKWLEKNLNFEFKRISVISL